MRIAVIGAGVSGIAAGVNLLNAGYRDFEIFEKAEDVGGTWRDNVYPGVACDVPSHLYRFSFAPKADWTMEYAPGAEIHSYMSQVAADKGLASHIHLGVEILRLEFDGAGWIVTTSRGGEGRFDAVISAMGVLHKEVYPDIPGRDTFAGQSFHSSKWPVKASLDGKRVAIIGTGSTAVQILPAILDQVKGAAMFMRTPQWVFPLANKPIPEEKKAAFHKEPKRLSNLYAFLGERLNRGLAASVVGLNEEGLREIGEACERNLQENVTDLELRAKLTPDYQVGCKRLVVSSAFYPAIQRENAELITDGITAIEPAGIRTEDGKLHAFDVIVYATGFDPFNFHRPMKIIGRDGLDLDEVWAGSAQALRSVMAPGFPNLFFIGGPNSPIGNFSFLLTAETQIGYIMGLLAEIGHESPGRIEPRADVTEAYNRAIEVSIKDTIWVTGGCTSWYFDPSGKVASWPWSYERFEADLRKPDTSEYILS